MSQAVFARVRLLLVALALLLCPAIASPQEQPRTFRIHFHTDGVILLDAEANDKPSIRVPHYNRKALIAEVSLLATAKAADAISTRRQPYQGSGSSTTSGQGYGTPVRSGRTVATQ